MPQTCRRVSNFLLEISKSNFWTFRLRKCRISSLPISKKTQFVKQTCEKLKIFKTTLKTQGRVHDFHSAILKSHCRTLRPRRCRISKLRTPPPKKSKFTNRSHQKKHVLLRQKSKRTIPENDVENTDTCQQFSAGNSEIAILNISTSKMSNFKTVHVQKDAICEANIWKMTNPKNDVENVGTRQRFSPGNSEIAALRVVFATFCGHPVGL